MTQRRHTDTARKGHQFGGSWTTAKLELIAKYLSSYTTALKDKPSKQHPFKKGYIDAFAGTGYRDAQRGDSDEKPSQALLLPDLAEREPQEFLDGSARLALKTEPRFDSYVFIERSASRSAQLETLKSEFPDLANRIQIRRGDANAEIQKLCKKDWSSHRSVLFLDPYGMQVIMRLFGFTHDFLQRRPKMQPGGWIGLKAALRFAVGNRPQFEALLYP